MHFIMEDNVPLVKLLPKLETPAPFSHCSTTLNNYQVYIWNTHTFDTGAWLYTHTDSTSIHCSPYPCYIGHRVGLMHNDCH